MMTHFQFQIRTFVSKMSYLRTFIVKYHFYAHPLQKCHLPKLLHIYPPIHWPYKIGSTGLTGISSSNMVKQSTSAAYVIQQHGCISKKQAISSTVHQHQQVISGHQQQRCISNINCINGISASIAWVHQQNSDTSNIRASATSIASAATVLQ